MRIESGKSFLARLDREGALGGYAVTGDVDFDENIAGRMSSVETNSGNPGSESRIFKLMFLH